MKIKKVYLGTKQIYPDCWSPGENTIAYYPLTSSSTVNDLSGNGYNLTNSNVAFGTYAGVSCASFNGSNGKLTASITTIPQGSNPRTMSFWLYNLGGNLNNGIIGYGAARTRYGCFLVREGTASEGYVLSMYYIDINSNVNIKNAWLHIVATFDGTSSKLYVNGEIKGTNSTTLATSGTNFEIGNPYQNNYYKGYISNAILEKKARTAQEIADYYNQTKSNYGL